MTIIDQNYGSKKLNPNKKKLFRGISYLPVATEPIFADVAWKEKGR